jgi:hypothetical protein
VFGEMKKLSAEGKVPVQKALSSSPTLKGVVTGKPEVNQAAGQSQGAKPAAAGSELDPLEKSYYSQPKSMFDPRTGSLLK